MWRSLWLIFCVGIAMDAAACAVCVMAAADLALPPIHLWMLVAVSWFLSNGIVRSVTGVSLPYQPEATGAVALVFVGLIAAGAAFGPLTVLPLGVPPAYAFVRSLVQRRRERAVKVIGLVHTLAIAVVIMFTAQTLRTRSDAEYIAQWPDSPTGRAKFAKLRNKEPHSLPAYRELLSSDSHYVAGEAAERIGDVGDPVVDIPLLMRASQRFRDSDDTREKLERALEKLREKRGDT